MDNMSAASGMPRRQIAEDALAVLQLHDWPGNIRQLKNNVERLYDPHRWRTWRNNNS